MAVKPSAITGAGTENNPYVIHNYDELKWCCEDADAVPEGQAKTDYVYVKVNNDIDCSTYGMSFRWFITCEHAVDFNLNNKTIENFYIGPGRYMFFIATTARKLSVHDGKILNVYGDWISNSYSFVHMGSGSDDSALTFKNISMSIDISNFTYNSSILCSGTSQKMSLTNCTLDIKGTLTSTAVVAIMTGIKLYTCDVHIDVTSRTTVYIVNGYNSAMAYALNCRFMGQLHLPVITGTSYCMYCTTIRNCVIDLSVLVDTASTYTPYFVYGPGQVYVNYGIYNVDKLTNHVFTNTQYIACTTSDMDMRVNPNADTVLQEKGFDVIKG